jgi:hypothetical protein
MIIKIIYLVKSNYPDPAVNKKWINAEILGMLKASLENPVISWTILT